MYKISNVVNRLSLESAARRRRRRRHTPFSHVGRVLQNATLVQPFHAVPEPVEQVNEHAGAQPNGESYPRGPVQLGHQVYVENHAGARHQRHQGDLKIWKRRVQPGVPSVAGWNERKKKVQNITAAIGSSCSRYIAFHDRIFFF